MLKLSDSKYAASFLVEVLLITLSMIATLGKAMVLLALILCGTSIARVICTYGLGAQPGIQAAFLMQWGGVLWVVFRVSGDSMLRRIKYYLNEN